MTPEERLNLARMYDPHEKKLIIVKSKEEVSAYQRAYRKKNPERVKEIRRNSARKMRALRSGNKKWWIKKDPI